MESNDEWRVAVNGGTLNRGLAVHLTCIFNLSRPVMLPGFVELTLNRMEVKQG